MSQIITAFLYGIVAANIIVTAVVLSSGFRDLKNILFSLIALATALWAFSIGAFYVNLSGFNWILLSHSLALFISLVFYYFAQIFPLQLERSYAKTLIPFGLFLVALHQIFFTQNIVGGTDGIVYTINNGYVLYSILVMTFFLLGCFYLYRQYKKATDDLQKTEVKYILLGYLLSYFLATVTDLILPYFGVYEYTWMGPLFTLILVGSIFAAISKYRLFNAKVIATQLFIFSLWVFILVRAAAATDPVDKIANVLLLLLTVIIGIFLIRSVFREVEQREKIEKLAADLEVANEKLREMDLQKSEFVSIASHQLRSPLTAIKGYTSMLLEGSYGDISEKVRGTLERIFQSGQTLVVVIENFLNLSRIEQGRMAYTMTPLDLRVLTRQVVDQLSPNAQKKGLNLSYDFHPTEEPESTSLFTVTADGEKIRQVILNLLDNSIKYTPKGTVRVLLEKAKTRGIRLTISDTGIGMSKETIEKLFKKFSRADGAGKVNAGGSGLGLYLAGEIMAAHKGKVWAESEGEGKGSSFIVELGTE